MSILNDRQFDEEMASIVGLLEQHTEDSSADFAAGEVIIPLIWRWSLTMTGNPITVWIAALTKALTIAMDLAPVPVTMMGEILWTCLLGNQNTPILPRNLGTGSTGAHPPVTRVDPEK